MFTGELRVLFLLLVGSSGAHAIDIMILASAEKPLAPTVQHTLIAELQHIMKAVDVQLEWYPRGEAFGIEFSSSALIIIQFLGKCEMSGEQNRLPVYAPGVLAATHILDGEIRPFIDVFCDRTIMVLSLEMQRVGWAGSQVLLGRALGRVLAHELYHVLARTDVHGKWGLSQRHLTPSELVGPGSWFEGAELQLMRMGLRGTENPDSTVSARAGSTGSGVRPQKSLPTDSHGSFMPRRKEEFKSAYR
jgi:hypothetical protein